MGGLSAPLGVDVCRHQSSDAIISVHVYFVEYYPLHTHAQMECAWLDVYLLGRWCIYCIGPNALAMHLEIIH